MVGGLVLVFVLGLMAVTDEYKIYLDRMEVETDKSYYIVDLNLFRLNRTTKSMNMTFTHVIEIPRNSEDFFAEGQVHEFLDNQYKPFAVRFRQKLCEFMGTYYKMFLYSTTPDFFPPQCPIKKGVYRIYNWIPMPKFFQNLPFRKTLFVLKAFHKQHIIFKMDVYARFDRDAIYREEYAGHK